MENAELLSLAQVRAVETVTDWDLTLESGKLPKITARFIKNKNTGLEQ